MIRETIYAGLYTRIAALAGNGPLFATATRKLATWENVAPEECPALLQRQGGERAEYRKGLPTRWWLDVQLYLYVHTGGNNDPTISPSTLLNPLIDAIDGALAPDDVNMNAFTMGGLVSHCAINGRVEIFEGTMGDEAVAIVPIEILTTQ